MIRGFFFSLFLFGLDVAILRPQGSSVSIQNCSWLSRNSLVSSDEAWIGTFSVEVKFNKSQNLSYYRDSISDF